jgi:Ca-activated chloride channel family protein
MTATAIDKDGRLVTDLTKDDFEVLDNGVPREITVFRSDAIPFAVAILFDVSLSMDNNTYTMRQGVSELIARFQPGDRATIGAFWGMTEISPRFTANAKTLLGWVNATVGGAGMPCASSMSHAAAARIAMAPKGYYSAVWNAVECGIDAVAKDAETPRRVVLLITDGVDNASIRRPEDVARYAAQFGVMIYAIGLHGIQGTDDTVLRTLAESTGGGYFKLLDRGDLPATFARLGEELRHQYVFGISPNGSAAAHKLDVRVRRPNVLARSRRVYMEATPIPTSAAPPEPAAAPAPTPPAVNAAPSASVLDTLERYDRGDPAARPVSSRAAETLHSSFEELRKSAAAWVRSDAVRQPQRRLAIAAYALDLINANLDVLGDGATMAVRRADFETKDPGMSAETAARLVFPVSAADIVELACSLLRDGPPVPAEGLWHLASIAALERFHGQTALDDHVEHAQKRFAGEPQLVLARAVAQESRTWPDRRDDPNYQPPSGQLASRTEARFKDAAAHDATRQEAHLRWGYFALRRGRVDDALTHFKQTGEPEDVALRYWLYLFQGRALERANRPAEALASYRSAFDAVPHAQSATTALGAALLLNHRRDEAAALMQRMLRVPPPLDPWRYYTYPAWRHWTTLVSGFQDAVKR